MAYMSITSLWIRLMRLSIRAAIAVAITLVLQYNAVAPMKNSRSEQNGAKHGISSSMTRVYCSLMVLLMQRPSTASTAYGHDRRKRASLSRTFKRRFYTASRAVLGTKAIRLGFCHALYVTGVGARPCFNTNRLYRIELPQFYSIVAWRH